MTKSRVYTAYLFLIATFILLLLRYAYLQLYDHSKLLEQSISNYSSTVATLPIRGGIIDKNGVVLADNKASYVAAVLPKDLNTKTIFDKIDKYVNITEIDRKKLKAQLLRAKKYDWVVLKDDLSNSEIANLTSHNYEFPEVSVFAHIKRSYPFDELYAHSIGYVGRVSERDRDKLAKLGQLDNYVANDYVGKNGLEDYYENILRGELGRKVIKTDSHGNEVGLIANEKATDGYTLQLTIDNSLQKLAWGLLGDHKGAVVAIDPQTGGVLAFVSKPGFDPNWFIDGISIDDWEDLSKDPKKPLLNRAAGGTYAPGSTFKPFLGLVSLYLGIRSPSYRWNDIGYFVIPGSHHRFKDTDHVGGIGSIDMIQAITVSSDTFFYKLALDMGIDAIHKNMSFFGLGQKTGIDLPHEDPGLLPSREWKAKRFAKDSYQKNWLPSDSVNIGIGQGFNHYTPLQMAHAVSIIAADGKVIKPHLFDKVLSESGMVLESYQVSYTLVPFQESQIKYIKKAMQNVVLNGTARGISNGLKYTMAGKTGTAQVVSLGKNSRHAKFSGEDYKDHSWFIAFAPVDHPKIALAVLVENGGFGAATAAPIARQLFDQYLIGSPVESDADKHFMPKHDASDVDEEQDTEEDTSEDTTTSNIGKTETIGASVPVHNTTQ